LQSLALTSYQGNNFESGAVHISLAFFFVFLFPLGVLHFLEPGEGRWEDRDGELRGLLSRVQSGGFWDGVRLGLCITQHNAEF